MHIFRWLLVVPIAIVGWYIGLFTWAGIYQLNEWLCPNEYKVSGMCYAPWTGYVHNFAIASGSIVAAALVVLLPTLIAPSHRYNVARVSYILGLICSIYFLVIGPWVPVAWAALGGGISLWFILRVLTLRSRGTPQKRVAP